LAMTSEILARVPTGEVRSMQVFYRNRSGSPMIFRVILESMPILIALIAASDKHYPTRDEKETVLLRVCENNATKGVDEDGYPRGEVVIVREQ
jgi:hypothetical protein